MKNYYMGLAAVAAILLAAPALTDSAEAGQVGVKRGQEKVCLVTFFKSEQVSAGADANVQRARFLPRFVAERRDHPNDRNRIFTYGSNQKTHDTCKYLNGINN